MTNRIGYFSKRARHSGNPHTNVLDILAYYDVHINDGGKEFTPNYGRKAWEPQRLYDLKSHKCSIRATETPDVSTLPENRWVVIGNPRGSVEEVDQWVSSRDQWFKDQKVKYHKAMVKIDNKDTWVFVFKKSCMAVLYKMTWC